MALSLAIGAAIACAFGLAGCNTHGRNESDGNGGTHTGHSYTEQIAEAQYLKTAADCTHKAVYYKSCTCGEKGTETFEYGEPNGHSYTQEKAEAKYLEPAANCTHKAVYYKSCAACGTASETETFEYGEPNGHTYSPGWSKDNAKHWHECEVCHDKKDIENHDFTNVDCVCGASKYTRGLEYTLNDDKQSYTCTGLGTATETDIIIADVYNGKNVTGIGSGAFLECGELTSVTISSGVKSIGRNAFNSCDGLTSVTIPDGVTSIGSSAFNACCKLYEIVIPASVTSIGFDTFYLCEGLTIYCEVAEMPSTWSSHWNTGDCTVVWDCKNNDKDVNGFAYTIADGVRYAIKDGEAKVARQSHGIKTANIQSAVTYKGVTFNVTSIGSSAFYECGDLTSVTIPNSVNCIGDSAFYDCGGLSNINIPNSVISISDNAFGSCIGLTSLDIPNGVTSIGNVAFRSCSNLISITIPSSVTSIGETAFIECKVLTIYCEAKETPSGWDSRWKADNVVIWDYKNNDKDENGYSYTIADGLKFALKDGVATVIKPINKNQDVNIPASVTYKDTTYNVTAIGENAFKGCFDLVSVDIPNGVTSIGASAFYYCKKLENVTIPSSVISIGSGAFLECGELKSITIPNGVESIGFSAFRECSKLTSIIIPNSVTSIGEFAFVDCNGLISVTLSNKLTSLAEYLFFECYKLSSIIIPDSVTYIGSSAFSGCGGLTSVTIGKNIISIGEEAFDGCSELTSIIYKGTKAQWNEVEKGTNLNYITGDLTVICTDGNLDKNGNELV